MLVIKRKKNEGIRVGEDVTIKIIGISDGAVKIAIDAPRETMILRCELIEEVTEENKSAILGNMDALEALKSLKK